jgi:hypothetical protein
MIFSKVNPQENCDSDTNLDSESDDPISTAGVGFRKKPHNVPPTGYALLFNLWAINSRIPVLRLLWKQRPYQYSLPKRASSPKPSESGKRNKPTYPVDQLQPRSVVDYPLRRARLLTKTLVTGGIVWMRLKLLSLWRPQERSNGDYKAEYSTEWSMRRHGSDPDAPPAEHYLLFTVPGGTRLTPRFGAPLKPPESLEPRLQKRKSHNAPSLVPGLVSGGVRGGEASSEYHQRLGWDRMAGRFPPSGWPFWRRRKSTAKDIERGVGVEQEPGGASTSLEPGGRKFRERV